MGPYNAALEWQARSLGCSSGEMMAACPLEGLVRSVVLPKEKPAFLSFTSDTLATADIAVHTADNLDRSQ
jgi:hypothetical protein